MLLDWMFDKTARIHLKMRRQRCLVGDVGNPDLLDGIELSYHGLCKSNIELTKPTFSAFGWRSRGDRYYRAALHGVEVTVLISSAL